MAEKDKYADEMLTDDELDKVAGGWFWQGYNEDQVKAAGVTWIHNYFSADEFIYKGKNVTTEEANAVISYVFFKKEQPSDMKEATKWYDDYKNNLDRKNTNYAFQHSSAPISC